MIIGQKLRKIRELHNFTEKFVADKINLSVSQYSKIERNESPLTLARLEEIAKIYNVSCSDILNWDDKNIFNFNNNNIANGIIQNQQISTDETLKDLISQLKSEIIFLKEENKKLWELINLKEKPLA